MSRVIHFILTSLLVTMAAIASPVYAQIVGGGSAGSGTGGTSSPDSVPGLPSISITRTPSPMVAGQSYTVRWITSNADYVHYQCTSSGGGFAGSGDLDISPNTSTGTADPAWVGHNSTCVWTAYNDTGGKSVSETMVTVAPSTPAPTISISRTPNPMVAGQSQTFTWNTTNATSVSFVCSASGTGYNGSGTQSTVNGTSTSVASAAWVGYPSTCTWTATGSGGSSTTTETLTTVAATPAPTISVSRTPNPMVAGQSQTFTWNTTNATSVSFVCSASGTGYSGSGTQPTVNGTSTSVASAVWVGYPSTCVWTASGAGGSSTTTETLTTVAATPAPTISVQRTPSPLVAGQSYTTNWSTTDATSLSYNCTANGTGFAGNASLATSGSSPGTANAAWVGYPSTCTWTAIGAGGTKTYTETMTTIAATPAPTISVSRTPNPMVAGQSYTLNWSSTNATSVSYSCTASGTGYASSAPVALNGPSSGTAQAAWVGYPSTCIWTANGPGGTSSFTETMTTLAAPSTETVIYHHTDGLGSPIARTNEAGVLVSKTRYEPYGMTVDGTTPPDIGFTGHVNDSDTGLTYMQQRYYDPVAGRFLSEDPVLTDSNSGSGFNRYAYANNNPYKYIDPDGRNPLLLRAVYGASFAIATRFGAARLGGVIAIVVWNAVHGSDKPSPVVGAGMGCIYCVKGDKTSSGLDYIGSTDNKDQREKDSSDGRDRKGAEVIDTYTIGDLDERRRKEQQAINDKGGLAELDNLRNEIAEKKWDKKGVKPPEPKPPESKPPEKPPEPK